MPTEPSRGQLFLGNVSRFNIEGAMRSIFDPDSLTPLERRTPVDNFLPEAPGYIKDALETVTDPLVMIGLALHMRFPIPKGAAALEVGEKVSALNRKFVPGLSQLLDFRGMFQGTKTEKTLPALVKAVTAAKDKWAGGFRAALLDYQKATGKVLSEPDEILLFARLAGLDKEGSLALNQLRGVLGNKAARFRSLDRKFASNTPLGKLHDAFRKQYDDIFDETFATAAGRKSVQELRRQMRQEGVILPGAGDDVERIREFAPFMAQRNKSEIGKRMAALEQSSGRNLDRVSKGRVFDRTGGMVPSVDDLRRVEGELQGGMLRSVEDLLGRELTANTPQFTMKTTHATSTYVHGLARFKGFNIDGTGGMSWGARLQSELAELEKIADGTTSQAPQAKFLAKALKDTYIPLARDSHNVKDGMFAIAWESSRGAALGVLEGIRKKMVSGAGAERSAAVKGIDKLKGLFLEGGALHSSRTAGNRLTSLFYQGALGLNPRSAAFNMFQSLNTASIIGGTSTARGMGRTITQFEKFFRLRLKGKDTQTAFAKAFPEATKAGVVGDPITAFVLDHGDNALRAAKLSKKSIGDRVQAAMMGMFQTSESFVRMSAFNGGLIHAQKAGLGVKEAVKFATRLAEETQFFNSGGQFLGTPFQLLNLPPLLRQFGTFASRQAQFLFQRGTVLGSAENAVQKGEFLDVISGGLLRGRNLGVAGRFMLGTGIAKGAFQSALGVDISDATFTGGLPTPREFGPFAPLPIVPPIFSVVGGLAMDITSGEFKNSKFGLPLFIPGGVAATRALSTFSPDAAKLLGRKYADFNDRDGLGKVPLFKSNGSLIGRFSPLQIYAEGAGISIGDVRATQEFARRMVAQRDRIRGVRKAYIESLLNNDVSTAQKLDEEFKQDFGFGITYRKQDLEAARLRRQVTQLEQIARTMPGPDLKKQYLDAVRVFVSGEASRLGQLGVDPAMLQPGVSAREVRQSNLAFPASTFPQGRRLPGGSGRFSSSNNPGGGFLSPFGSPDPFETFVTGPQ